MNDKRERRCRIYTCREMGRPLCCADCRQQLNCLERCLNWPSRCRCSVNERKEQNGACKEGPA